MIHTLDDPIFDWYGAGYDAFLAAAPAEARAGWALVRAAIAHARRGDLRLVSRVAQELVARTPDPVLHSVACGVVGDAGDAAALELLVLALSPATGLEYGLDIVHALAARGRLLDVPAVFRFYETHREHPDSDVVPALLNWLLAASEDERIHPEEGAWEAYRAAIAGRYFGLWHAFGTNLVHVRHGRAFELGALAHDMLADLREGFLDGSDRRAFEVSTGRSCSAWFTDERVNLLTVAADLEDFIASGAPAGYPPGQRAFMGHWLEDVGAAEQILASYPHNRGLGIPEVRTTFDVDAYFALPLGFEPFHGGYFVRSTKPPPSADRTVDADWPWLSLHTGLRAAMAGDRTSLAALAKWIGAGTEPILRGALIHLIARAGSDRLVAPWRDVIRAGEDPDLTLALCEGLLRRGILGDVPLVLDAYVRNVGDPDYAHLPDRFNLLLAFRPVRHGCIGPMELPELRAIVMRRVEQLRSELGRDDAPIFRGELFDVISVATEIVELRQTPYVTVDLRERFEASTGIDCSAWEVPGPFDPEHAFDRDEAAASARRFLADSASRTYRPGQLYFFGHAVEQPADDR